MTDNQENSKYQCPRCHSENIQSYSLIHSMGISKIDLSTVGVGYSNNLGGWESRKSWNPADSHVSQYSSS